MSNAKQELLNYANNIQVPTSQITKPAQVIGFDKQELLNYANNIQVPTSQITKPAKVIGFANCITQSRRMRAYVSNSVFSGITLLFFGLILLLFKKDQKGYEYKASYKYDNVILYKLEQITNGVLDDLGIPNLKEYSKLAWVICSIVTILLIVLFAFSVEAANHELNDEHDCETQKRDNNVVFGLITLFFVMYLICAIIIAVLWKNGCMRERNNWRNIFIPAFVILITFTLLPAFALSIDAKINHPIQC